MYFKSLEISGFKSFADKTLVEFPKGITAIVGPNGSGKSNIMDALRWVFGEQRASELRGDDMEDVIFSGSVSRRLAGFAQVSLTLDDVSPEISGKWGSMSELTVTRKIFRTGEREYLINGRKSRLKDIKEIFFDTGIGSKSISIIEQERVTKIVNSTPQELRYFLEETAGLVRYKERRKEAETRLKQTHENLIRISDIIAMLASDLERLAKQTADLNEYRRLKGIRTGLEKSSIAVAYGMSLKEEQNINTALDKNRSEITRLSALHGEKVTEEVAKIKLLEELFIKLKELRAQHDKAKSDLSSAESDIRHMTTSMQTAEQQKARLEEDIKQASARKEELELRLAKLTDGLDEMAGLVEEFTERLDEQRNTVSLCRSRVASLTDEQKDMSKAYIQNTQKLSECANRLSLKQAEINTSSGNIKRLQSELDSLHAEHGSLQGKVNGYRKTAAVIESELDTLKEEISHAKTAFEDRYRQYEHQRDICDDLSTQIKITAERIEFLRKEALSKSTGGNAGLELIERFGGKRYTDIDSSEESYLLYGDLLLFQEEQRSALLQYIQSTDISIRFCFNESVNASGKQGAEKLADRLYLQDGIYTRIGSDSQNLALMQLDERLKAAEKSLSEYEETLVIEVEKADLLKEDADESQSGYNIKAELIKTKERDYTAILTNLSHLEEQAARLIKNASVVEKEIELAKRASDGSLDEAKRLTQQHAKLTEEKEKLDEEREMLDERLEQANTELEDQRDEESHLARELARYTERENAMQADKKQLISDMQAAERSVATLHSRLDEIAHIFTPEWAQEYDKAVEQRDICARIVLEIADNVAVKERLQPEYEAQLTDVRTEINRINEQIHEHDKKLAQYEQKIDILKASMQALAAEMLDTHGERLDETWQNYFIDKTDQERIAADISAINQAIEGMGALNMAADEEYAAKSAQHDEQMAQMHDIEKAIDSLNGLISEIDDSTVSLFSETFAAVRKNFTDVFSRFFGSGTADLTLTEPDNLLATGVELIFSPPGKKISNKNLLSGGEKALAALTLLFALFLQKPTPFCFLDEVDAPLDDANAQKFIAMLRLLSNETQFVIITHKHLSMAAADSLYGITMQEGGVSSMLSVRLESGREQPA